ncbi:LLM class flavin-dependent oxidoreductase [Jiangella asiatica]|uniref:LLM class flavin-dependent oxidoreductase n=1 Tax=Jiangella asiatica TaxID=2530372 RepID=A0A4R5CS73_9ACTN|nr:LLM class flavin-dependent oxidoreductase [Jiangella asiatica]TDE03419.1 LLM class flavin-dependent oxidoreductase [Jiangella asiatica]
MTPTRTAWFGIGISSAVAEGPRTLRLASQADRDELDLFSVSDHPYVSDRLDAYSLVGMALGRTQSIAGLVNVTNLPVRPAPMLSRTVTSLAALSGGRIVLGMGAGGLLAESAKLGVPLLDPAAAVRALEEGITLIRALSGGGAPVTFDGEFFQVTRLEPAATPAPPVWTGSNGPRSLAVTGRSADGWIPGHAADWLSHRYRTSRPVIDEAAVAAGRDPRDVATIYNLPGRITATPLAVTRDDDNRWVGGSVGQWVEELTGAVLEHGASGFTYFPTGDTEPEVALAHWAQEIVPAVRAAVAADAA